MKFLENSVVSFLRLFGLNPFSEFRPNAFAARSLTSIIELLIMFTLVLYSIQFLMSYVNTSAIKERLDKAPPLLNHVLASLFGAVTPFCTCSGIPLFTGIVRSGVPAGVAFSFLITSPLVNEVAIAGIWAIFGAKIALIYTALGILAGILGGMILGALKVDRYFTIPIDGPALDEGQDGPLTRSRFAYAWDMSWWIMKPVLPYLFIGVILGVGVTMAVDPNWIAALSGRNQFSTIPLAIIIGAPIYTSIQALFPLSEPLLPRAWAPGWPLPLS